MRHVWMKSSRKLLSSSSISAVLMSVSTPTMTHDMVVRVVMGWCTLRVNLVTEKELRAPELILRSLSWASRLSEVEEMVALPWDRVFRKMFVMVLVIAGSKVWVMRVAKALVEQYWEGSPCIA